MVGGTGVEVLASTDLMICQELDSCETASWVSDFL